MAIFLSMLCTSAFAEDFENDVLLEHITKWKGDSYQGAIHLTFNEGLEGIRAQIETDDLTLVSLTAAQLEDYVSLFTDPQAVKKYAEGQPWTRDEVEGRVQEWIARWEVNQDPFSAFAIFDKNKGGAFIGHIVLGHSSRHGQSELAFLFSPVSRDIDYATQAVTAVLYGYVPRLLEDQYLVNLNESTVYPSSLRSVHATGRFDDIFSGQAMIRSGMKIGESEVIWGAQRFHYLIGVDQIPTHIPQMDDGLYDTGD